MSKTAPTESLPEFAGFFENARAGRLAFPYCQDCGRFHWYPMPRCPHCRGSRLEWRHVSGQGKLYSFTRIVHPFDASRAAELPYVIGLVVFDDAPGVRLVTNIVGTKADQLQVGQTVLPVFRTDKNGAAVVEFRAAS
jgi:uncharacterized OB-fold protein